MPKPSRREAILTAAAERIVQVGLDELRMQDVAELAQVNPQLLAYHFPNRAALIVAVLGYAADRAPSVNMLHEGGFGSAIDTLRAALLAEFDESSSVRNLNLVWNEAAALPDADADLMRALADVTSAWDDRVTIGVLQCIAEGTMRNDEHPREIASVLTATVEGLSQSWLAGVISTKAAQDALAALLDVYRTD